jgi:hypothetical protein
VYVALLLFFGIHEAPKLTDYFEVDGTGLVDFHVADFMSRHRFQEISACLHFVDNASDGGSSVSDSDKLAKFRIPLELFNVACMGMFDPGRYVALDEAMVKCKSRFAGMKVRMPMKPVRDGIMIWCLCSQEGYV